MEAPPESIHDATNLIASVGSRYTGLATVLQPEDLVVALQAPDTHKQHPLAYLMRAGSQQIHDEDATQVLANLDRAIRASLRDTAAASWSAARLAAAAREPTLENASSLLAELRAFGFLWEAGLGARAIRTDSTPTPDFEIDVAGGAAIYVEVQCKQMNKIQAQALRTLDRSVEATHVIYPAGKPRDGETVAENVAQKVAQIKPTGSQASGDRPTLLWLDLQDSDWSLISVDYVEPFVVSRSGYFSGGLWHAIYGLRDDPLFEGNATAAMCSGTPNVVRTMAHNGLFQNVPNWAAVVFSMKTASIVFENPTSPQQLDDATRDHLCQVPWFDLTASRVAWPPCAASSVQSRVERDRERLKAMAQRIPQI